MATTSITKKFIIKDDVACKKLVDALESTPAKKQVRNSCSSSYERGKELLVMRYPVCITEEENWIVATDMHTNIASQGKSVKEALANLKEALELYYEDADNSNVKGH